ncbi:MAG: hypothetical protein EKK41_14560 [Hyphomicrobiales bacterium]|jgi:hypothetical protein|nr:MAG: hypothetical protein EKK41_14560 [Hyphomicrobiales bacterium]
MTSRLLVSVPCRVYGFLACAAGLVGLVLAIVLLSWAKFGPPEGLLAEIEKTGSGGEFRHLATGLGVTFLAFGVVHAFIGLFALAGRSWAMIVGTIAWAIFLIPSFFAAEATAYDCAGVFVLGALCLLTLLTLAARFAAGSDLELAPSLPA